MGVNEYTDENEIKLYYVSEIITSGNVSEMLNFMDEIVSTGGLIYATSFTSNNLMTFS